MSFTTNTALSMSATGSTPWVRLQDALTATLQLSCGAVNTPVGVVTVEFSNDERTIANEIAFQVTPANTAAVKSDVSASLTVVGAALATGYDGSGAKVSYMALPAALPAYARVKYTRTSGGAADILTARFTGR